MDSRLMSIPLALLALAVLASGAGAQCGLSDKLTAADAAAGDEFGWSVSLSGDTALVGALYDDDGGSASGSAYVFEKQGSVWVETTKLTASDAAVGDEFGQSVSLSGDTALVGAPGDDFDTGSAYVFEKQGTVWIETVKLTASDAPASGKFGYSVSLWGDTALVGAFRDDHAGPLSGSAYVFEKQGTVWVETAKFTASDAAAYDDLGLSVSLSGDTAVVGARSDDDGGLESGSAYVFEKPPSGWVDMTETAKLTASDAAADDWFGWSVSLSGDTALVGAHYDDDAGERSGSAYVFEKQGTVWVETAKLTASDGAAEDNFGYEVSLSGDAALVGAFRDGDAGSQSGSAYVFEKQGSVWVETTKLTASDAAADDWFGISVSLSGDTALVGARLDDDGGTDSGSAYVFPMFVGQPCLSDPTPGIVSSFNIATVSNATPGGQVWLGFSLATSSTPVGGICPGLTLSLNNPTPFGPTTVDASGNAFFGAFVPPSLSGAAAHLQGLDVSACKVTNLVSHTFP